MSIPLVEDPSGKAAAEIRGWRFHKMRRDEYAACTGGGEHIGALPADSEAYVRWMFADAGIIKALASSNPWRWSTKLSYSTAVRELTLVEEEEPNKPIRLQVWDGASSITTVVNNAAEAVDQLVSRLQRLPIILVPGFVCAGLRVDRSTVCPDWQPNEDRKGKRIWLDLPRIGFSSLVTKGLRNWETWEEDEGERRLKNMWLRHLTLKGPEEEADGIHIKVIEGLDGVKSLDASVLFAAPTRIFGPVISKLLEVGYEEDVDLSSCNFDWRFAPGALQRRVAYFDNLISTMENLNAGAGVALLGHSMGNKTVQYFIEYAKEMKGQAWLDKHFRVWVASAAPHLGAPQAAKATLFGDRFGLDPFLSISEAVIMARSFSSSPWMFPIGAQAGHFIYLRRQGLLQVTSLKVSVPGSSLVGDTHTLQVRVEVSWGRGHDTNSVDSSLSKADDDGQAIFDEECNFMHFGGPAELPSEAYIMVTIKERKQSYSEMGTLSKLKQRVKGGLQVLAEWGQGHSGLGVPRADTLHYSLTDVAAANGEFVELALPIASWRTSSDSPTARGGSEVDEGTVFMKARWLNYEGLREEWLGSQDLMGPKTVADTDEPLHEVCQKGGTGSGAALHHYDPIDVHKLLKMEGCTGVSEVWRKYYQEDPYFNDLGENDVPSVGRVASIHGVNLITDVGYAVKLHTCRLVPAAELRTRFVLDTEAQLQNKSDRFSMNGGIIYEVPNKQHPSGDGVVPLRSMEHCRNWSDSVHVDVYRIEGAEHKVVLHKDRYADILREVVDLVGDKTWSLERSIDIGPHRQGLEGVRMFDRPMHKDLAKTVENLKSGSLAAPEGFCVAYCSKSDSFFLLHVAGRREAALLALGPRAHDSLSRGSG